MMDATMLRLWQALAFETIHRIAATADAFSTDDVWKTLEALSMPADPRAIGPIFTRAAKAGLLYKSDMIVASTRKICHARPVAV